MVAERGLVRLFPEPGEDAVREVARLRQAAAARYSEVDLLVAALREHIADLRSERNRLRAEVDALRSRVQALDDTASRHGAAWMWRGQKGPH